MVVCCWVFPLLVRATSFGAYEVDPGNWTVSVLDVKFLAGR